MYTLNLLHLRFVKPFVLFFFFFLFNRTRLTLEDHYETVEVLFRFYAFHPSVQMSFLLQACK